MNDMTWLTAAIGCAIGLFVICAVILAWCCIRDMRLRGVRVSNREIERERITITMPSFALRDFKNRSYGDSQ